MRPDSTPWASFGPAAPAKRHIISLTPLIDVVFILLLFFMLTSSFAQWTALELRQPTALKQAPNELPQVVRLSPEGRLNIGPISLGLDAPDSEFRLHLAEYSGHPLIIQPYPEVTAQQIVKAFERLRTAGATQVTLTNAAP